MLRSAPFFVLLLLAASCQGREPEGPAALISQVRARLAERDQKLYSYHLVSSVVEGPRQARFEFFFRSPNRMRGVLLAPATGSFSFDGERLYQRLDSQRKFDARRLSGKLEENALLLSQVFSPFSPEGFRTPLLLSRGAIAARVAHPRATEAVEVRQVAEDPPGAKAQIRYIFRWPALDFLEKHSEVRGESSETRVEDERCDRALGLCVPVRLSQWAGGAKVGTQEISSLELNPALPEDSFRLAD